MKGKNDFHDEELVKVSLPRLATNVQPQKSSASFFNCIFLLNLACSLPTRTSIYLEIVARNDIIDGLGSVNPTLNDKNLKLFLTRHHNLPDILDS